MADLITASGGQLVVEPGTTLTAQFDRPEKAVHAARRLQRALLAFTESSGTAAFAASIVIHKPEDQVRSRLALAVDDLLWSDFAAPGQILLSGSAHEILQFIPGLQFRPVPLDDGGSGPAYQELLWIEPGALDAWRARVVAASQVVWQPDQERESDLRIPEVEASAEDSPVATPEDRYGSVLEPSIFGSDTPGKQKRLWMAGGTALLTLVAIFALVVHMKSNKTIGAGKPQEPKVAVQPTAREQEPRNPSQPSEKQQAVTEKPEPEPPKPPAPAAKPHRATRETDIGVAEYEGFTAKQVPQLIRRADEDAGAGYYDAAKREYEIVLKLQPNNTAAKEGLHRLSLKISER